MNVLREKLKSLVKNIGSAANWVGNHLGAVLTIFSVVAGFLFLRERNKRHEAETTLALDEKTDAVEAAKQEVEHVQQEADDSLSIYNKLKSYYDSSHRIEETASPRKPRVGKKGGAKRVSKSLKRLRQGAKRSNKAKS